MPNREPEPWESSATRPFLRIGTVEVRTLGEDRFTVKAPAREQLVVGFETVRQTAHTLAGELE